MLAPMRRPFTYQDDDRLEEKEWLVDSRRYANVGREAIDQQVDDMATTSDPADSYAKNSERH